MKPEYAAEPEYKFSRNPEIEAAVRSDFKERHEAERQLEKSKRDHELRRWCIEMSNNDIDTAQKIYDWVRNKPKADAV